jgi:cyclopropane fatty-acyl-phospholipid synthase-like methyltransferase
VVGLDGSAANVRRARAAAEAAGLAERVRFEVGEPAQSIVEPATFDAIVSYDAFVVVANRARLFATLRQRLRPGGRLAFTAIVSHGAGAGRHGDSTLIAWPIPTADDYRALAERGGLRVLAVDDLTPTFREVSARWQGALLVWEQDLASELGYGGIRALRDTVAQIAAWATRGWLGHVLMIAEREPDDAG